MTRWVALMIQLDVRVRTPCARKFVGGVADTNYLYTARWGWIKIHHHLHDEHLHLIVQHVPLLHEDDILVFRK